MAKTTTVAPREGDPALLAVGYERDEAGVVRRSLYPYNRIHVPCGCVASNVLDMTRYAAAHLNRGELDGVRILAPESHLCLWPERRQSVVVLCNGDWVDPGAVTGIVADLLAEAE